MMLTKKDAHLAYIDTGAGSPPLVFVHGWTGNHTDFSAQIEAFRERHRVVAIDRRGHGESSARPETWTLADDADDIAWACRELALHKPYLVVHSQGGIGLEVAARHPDLLAGLILLDAPVFAPAPVMEQFRQALGGLQSPAWQDVCRGLADAVAFLPGDDPALKARVLDRMLRFDPAVLAASWRAFIEHDVEAAAARCKVPLMLISAVMPSDQTRLRALCPQVWIGQTVGCGHFHHLLVPDQVNAMIARFVR